MSNKKRSRKGIESLDKRIEEHNKKLQNATGEENLDLAGYYEKEIEHLRDAKKRLEHRVEPKLKRKRPGRKLYKVGK